MQKNKNVHYSHQGRKRDSENRRRKSRSITIIFSTICLITVLLTSYGIWQYYDSQKPPAIGSGAGASGVSQLVSAPDFSFSDINGTQASLSQLKGKVIGIHFMAVGCSGQINPINQYQLTQLNSACIDLCGNEEVAFLTVVVATCENSQLDVLRSDYGVNWMLGNDYSDGALDIINSYVPFEIGDGAIVLIDKGFKIAEVYNGGVSADNLINKMNQLSGA